ncbi:MAG: hypothetical protein CVU90_12225 [Firmicutes bacterium HGW-Firmicutes-15]|nr:MAG: hypothetical protein CVU90_12225 [Firmicutes bacterium HGW-Firmicutes-15]
MRVNDKKETLLVVFIVLTVVSCFLWFSNSDSNVIRENPPQQTILADSDFLLTSPHGTITVGKSTRDEVLKLYPEGKDLGKSGIYRPMDQDILLTFTGKTNILVKVDIGVGDLSSSRSIKVNDSFDKVLDKFGSNYTRAYTEGKPEIFDAYYGSDKYVLFKVENGTVKKIIIGNPEDQ